jgi:hypothetical protein
MFASCSSELNQKREKNGKKRIAIFEANGKSHQTRNRHTEKLKIEITTT